jgi:hypothetical protein
VASPTPTARAPRRAVRHRSRAATPTATRATLHHAASAVAATRRLAARLTAVPVVASARAGDAPGRMMYAISGAALLALAAAGALTLTRATRRTLP